MECKVCNDETNQIKAGKQRIEPKSTNAKYADKYYIKEIKKRVHSEETKNQAIKLYLEGNSGRAVARILVIGKNMCLYWIRKYAKNIGPEETPRARVNVIEKDALYSFVERKKQILRDNAAQYRYTGNRRLRHSFR